MGLIIDQLESIYLTLSDEYRDYENTLVSICLLWLQPDDNSV